MIKREYFFSCKALHSDGNGSYSYKFFTCDIRSFWPDPNKVFNDCIEMAKDEFEKSGIPNDKIEVVAFNRI